MAKKVKTFGELIENKAQKAFEAYKRYLALTEPMFEGDPFFKDPHGMARLDLVNARWVAERALQRFDELVAELGEEE